jgi:hypothetical protein
MGEGCMVIDWLPRVNTPPAKAGGFKLRLKAGPIGHSADSPFPLKMRIKVKKVERAMTP